METSWIETAPTAATSVQPTVQPFGDSAIGRLFTAKRTYARSCLADFKAHLEATDQAAASCPDEMLVRFIESHVPIKGMEVREEVNFTAAANSLAATLRWRADFGASTLHTCAVCDVDPFAHCLFSIGVDRRGWEVAYSCAGRTTKKDATSICRHLVAFLEAIFERPNPPTHFCLLLDLHGLGVGDLDPRVAIRAITILLSHYPDRVGQVALVDAPWFFSAIWSVLCKAIDPLSQQKALMLSRGAPTEDHLQRYLSDEQAQFMREMLNLRAATRYESFTPLTANVRRSLGPRDAFTRGFPHSCSPCGKPPAATETDRSGAQPERPSTPKVMASPRSGAPAMAAIDVQLMEC